MIGAREPACFTVHAKPHVLAALHAGDASARPVTVVSAPGAGAYAGPEWFLAMVRQASAEFPQVRLTAMLDCGDRAGDALRALNAGVQDIIFNGHPEAARRLSDIAAELGACIHARRPPSLDLGDEADAARAAVRWCEIDRRDRLLAPDAFGYGYDRCSRLDTPA